MTTPEGKLSECHDPRCASEYGMGDPCDCAQSVVAELRTEVERLRNLVAMYEGRTQS